MKTLPAPELHHLCDIEVDVGRPIEVGNTSFGLRRLVPILGGTVSGPALRGRVLPGGADFQLIVSGGTESHLDARYVIELEDGCRLFVSNRALRVTTSDAAERLLRGEAVDPSQVYFRCQPLIEAADQPWLWLNACQILGTGQRLPDKVLLSFYRVL